jgi:6-phosphofructokinase 1
MRQFQTALIKAVFLIGEVTVMKKIAVLTSGGDSPGMNAALRAVVRAGLYYGLEVTGIKRGYEGLVDGDFVPLDSRSVAGIVHRGGTILRTSRSQRFLTVEGRRMALDNLKNSSVDALVVIGGDGSFRGAEKLQDEGDIPVVGIPGTIDNDIAGTDETIGYDTALNTSLEAMARLRDTASSHDRLFIVEVMGRDSGFIALEVAVASGAEVAVIPETGLDMADLADKIHMARRQDKDHFFIVLAEGVMSAHELSEKLKDTAGYEARITVLGYVIRGGSPSCYDTVLATRMGCFSVETLMEGKRGLMVGCVNHEMVSVPLRDSWEKKKTVNPELLATLEMMNS